MCPCYYRPQRSCEVYVFTPVCHSVHRGKGFASVHAGIPPPRSRHPPRPGTPPDQAPPQTRHLPDQTPPPDQAGTPTPPGAKTATAADDTHPTGMLSWLWISSSAVTIYSILNWLWRYEWTELHIVYIFLAILPRPCTPLVPLSKSFRWIFAATFHCSSW